MPTAKNATWSDAANMIAPPISLVTNAGHVAVTERAQGVSTRGFAPPAIGQTTLSAWLKTLRGERNAANVVKHLTTQSKGGSIVKFKRTSLFISRLGSLPASKDFFLFSLCVKKRSNALTSAVK
jgi:hypothetical protein